LHYSRVGQDLSRVDFRRTLFVASVPRKTSRSGWAFRSTEIQKGRPSCHAWRHWLFFHERAQDYRHSQEIRLDEPSDGCLLELLELGDELLCFEDLSGQNDAKPTLGDTVAGSY